MASDTDGAVIWYTLDGTDPLTSETRQQYVEPIVINEETTVNAYAQAEGYLDSEVAKFHYTVKETSGVDDLYVGSLKVVALASNAGFKVCGVEQEAVVEVYDLSGKAAMAPITIQGDETILMDSVASGVYVVRVKSGDEVATLKLVKD
ncbi:MAG: chitobiase/beta-hexosaminidase C-terminal domain-containing protein [Muribaculaceae bacterium]|nr:chitobiase/beta-hexosaminidase C-terminal domain-containing protein [Muribaculaceae bacterium]